MFTLSKYVDSLLAAVSKEKSKKKRHEIVEAWIKMLKRHHRDLEGRKIIEIINEKIGKLEERAEVSVSDEKEQKSMAKYFKKKKIHVDIEVKPDLLGGTRIIWDNVLIDSTVSRQLAKLREIIGGKK